MRPVSRTSQHELALVFLRDPDRAWYGNQLCRETGLDASLVSSALRLWTRKGWIEAAPPDPRDDQERLIMPLLHAEAKRRWRRPTPQGVQELATLVKEQEERQARPGRRRQPRAVQRDLRLDFSRPLRRVASILMINPNRMWTTSQLDTVAGVNAHALMTKFLQLGMVEYTLDSPRAPHSVLRPDRLLRLTPKGKKALGAVLDWLSEPRLNDSQVSQCRQLTRDLIAAMPEEMADRMVLARGNVIHLITDSGEAYALTITPR